MRAANRPGRGERARVAERVRDLLGHPPDDEVHAVPPRGAAPPETPGWLPDLGLSLPRARAHHREGGDRPGERLRDRLRWDPGRRPVAALAVAVLVVIVASVWWYLGSRPAAQSLDSSGVAPGTVPVTGAASVPAPSGLASGPPLGSVPSAGVSTAPTSASASAAPVVVDVAGRVRRPGIYRLPADSRVYDALQAAGGPRRGVSTVSLNLAAPVQDGQQIVVGAPAAPAAPGAAVGAAPGDPAASAPAAVIDLNTATLEQLETLPGIGPVLGQDILDWRDAHGGRFDTIDQLREVSGIGDVRFAQIHDLVSV